MPIAPLPPGSSADAPTGGFFRRWVGIATALGAAVVLLDILVVRPQCPKDTVRPGCFAVVGDALGLLSMARLLSWGKFFISPALYELAGGIEAPFVGKPPALVGYMGAVLWLSERPLVAQALIVMVVGAAVAWVFRNRWKHPARRVAEVAVPILVVVSFLADRPTMLARVATSAVALLAIPAVAMVGRRLADERVGVVAAFLVALAPAVWVNASMLTVESLYIVALPMVLLATLRAFDSPTTARYAQLGAAMMVLSFTRLEGAAVVLALLVGLVITNHRTERIGRRVGLAVMALMIVVVPLVGWSTMNAMRQGRNAGVSPGGGSVLWSGACDEVVYGELRGFWTLCPVEETIKEPVVLTEAVDDAIGMTGYAEKVLDPNNESLSRALDRPARSSSTPLVTSEGVRAEYARVMGRLPDGRRGVGIWVDGRPVGDPDMMLQPGDFLQVGPNALSGFSEAEMDAGAGVRAIRYYKERPKELPMLAAARVGRAVGAYRPVQTVRLDSLVEGRGAWQPWAAMVFWWASLPLAVMGWLRLRGRRPLWPFGTLSIVVIGTVAISLGIPRYRLGLDVVACVLAAVPIAAWIGRRWPATGPTLSEQLAAEPETVESSAET